MFRRADELAIGSESSSSSEGTGTDTSSTTGEPTCECGTDDVLCETFEPPFAIDGTSWGSPSGEGSIEATLGNDPVHCGDTAVRTVVEVGDFYSVILGPAGDTVVMPGVHRLSVWAWIDEGCFAAPTRMLQLQYPNGDGVVWYEYALWIDDAGVELRMRNGMATFENTPAKVPLDAMGWHRFDLLVDILAMPPTGSVLVDGTTVIDTVTGPPLYENATLQPENGFALGSYRDGAAFTEACTMVFDDVRIVDL